MIYWGEFVSKFKLRFPHIQVIQLGGKKHRPIHGVDLNLAGAIPFYKSLQYLKGAIVHVDGDSGLVHARHLFKKPSVVIFGPTNVNYFAYPENVNLAPKVCGNCWWIKTDWMKNCVKGYDHARCMMSVTATTVIEAVAKAIR